MIVTPGTSANSALADALNDLPAKPRVHELAKRSGLSSKELVAALAERGIEVKSASSSVDRDAAVALLTALLGDDLPATAESTTGPEQPEEPAEAPKTRSRSRGRGTKKAPADEVASVDGPSQTSTTPVGGIPLFLEPEAPAAPVKRTRSRAAKKDAPADESAAPVSVADEGAESGTAVDTAAAEAPTDSAAPKRGRSRSRSSKSGAHADQAELTADEQTPAADAAADEAAAVADTEHEGQPEGGGRRRRRGRRGGSRAKDDTAKDDASADDVGQDDSGQDDAAGESQHDEPSDGSDKTTGRHSGDQPAEPGESADETDDQDDDTESGTGSRRRRRRRRRSGSGGGESARTDDPDNTVVHVREARSSDNEVQGIKGSTRLEAKRQRRRDSRESRRRPQILTEAEFLARRESVERVMAVRQRGDLAQVALLEDGVLVEHFVSKAGSASMIGNIYLGKVQNVLPSMEAAFVDIGRGRNAVLYAGEVNWDASGLQGKARRIETALSSGDTVLAQVSKDPIGHKGARLTTQISLPGRFLVYVPNGGATGISRKLPDTERKRLKAILDRIVPEDAGVIIRTAAEGVAEEELARDVERLKTQWEEIKKVADAAAAGSKADNSAPRQLSAEPDTLIKVVRDLFNSDITSLVLDGDDVYDSVSEYVQQVAPELADRVSRYTPPNGSTADVFHSYRIDEQIAKALERKVHLPSGGSLVIDRTEAMTVVDVNTGKYTGSGGNLEETVTKNNLEAAEEVVRQLRLRDIGGIIVVDFIDMVLESNRELVLRRLTECLGRDRSRHQVAEVTSLGLIQMTRKRMGTGLVEAFSEPCEHCHGRGIVLRDVPVDHQPEAEQVKPSGKKRRDRKRGSDSEPVEPIRINRVQADPRGPKPPLRPGAPVRHSADGTVSDGNAADGSADRAADLAAVVASIGENVSRESASAAADSAPAESLNVPAETVTDPAQVAQDVAEAVNAVSTGSDQAEPESRPAPKRGSRRRRATSNGVVTPAAAPVSAEAPSAPPAPVADQVTVAERTSVTEQAPVAAPEAKPARPRRRRAATRPAGPAGEAESVVIATSGS
ncbi:translation initiation factor IF-2 N-terminal domain-containing protein [Nakamurella lactea]|uniref:translation initiation factor IF-2 N-terminal domain-containing protein n=1 Tax=Nakamurella lactea TaxID=459515 RepID=UPI0004124138|nr:translation initiation factor IF-2 N-terminal domain-containing protein [Nakamurella lactea]